MDSGSSTLLAAARGHGEFGISDRLSRLGDAALGHILSFLPATEAARTATLSRRWRHLFAAVHTLSFGEAEAPFRTGNRCCGRCSHCEYGDVSPLRFVSRVSAALHGRHRGARAAAAPLRTLRVVFDGSGFRGGVDDTKALDSWLSYAAHGAGEALELEIDLRLATEPICQRAYALGTRGAGDDAKIEEEEHAAGDHEEPCACDKMYIVPRSLFSSCVGLRALRLDGCWINLPSAIALPSVNTLHLTRVTGRRGAIQQLLSACPSLVDLTLEACGNLTELCIDGVRLCRLALRCCHGLASVSVNSPELQTFEYRGTAPAEPSPPPFLTMHSPRKISFCALDFCGVERAAEVFDLLELFGGVDRLHLTSARLGSGFIGHDGAFPCFPMLHNLEITGMLPDYDDDASVAISTVARILEQTPRLQTLSLFFLPEPHPEKESRYNVVEKQVLDASHKLRYNPHACLTVPHDVVEIPCCLRETTKEINLVHYQGSIAQRALAKFLLCNAPVVHEVCWKVARGPLSIQMKLMVEIKGWLMNKSTNMIIF